MPRNAIWAVVAANLALVATSVPAFAQRAKPTDEQNYQAAIESCTRTYRSRQSSRNYRSGVTTADVDAKYYKCLQIERDRYARIKDRRARDFPQRAD